MKIKLILGIVFMFIITGCVQITDDRHTGDGMMSEEAEEEMEERMEDMMGEELAEEMEEEMDEMMDSALEWRNIELSDIKTGTKFKISDFNKPILIESFAVWCPTCRKQQDVIKQLHEEVGDSVISISLNTDPNEDADKVRGHIERYGYDWHFVISPVQLTQKLIDDFGTSVVNAPGAPVVLICGDGNAKLLRRGVKSVEELKSEIDGC